MIEINELIAIFTIATVLVGLFYLPAIKVGINLADEGYLWHGALKVLAGEIPVRDFRAYDPGRYYWCALWMRFLGSHLLSLRAVMLITQVLALSAGLTAVYIASFEWLTVFLAGLTLVLWMFPSHKQVDILFSITTPLIAVWLVASPVDSQYLISGVYVCACLFFGLNHGIYAGVALMLILLIMGIADQGLALTEALSWYALGLASGMTPLMMFYVFVPRLFKVYWQKKVSRIIKRRTANLPLPVPWIWKSNTPQLAQLDKAGQFLVKLLFSFLPLVYVVAILAVFIGDSPASDQEWYLLAIACSGLLYLHHAFSRADLSHLTQSIAPFLMGLVIFFTDYSYGWIAIFLFIMICLKLIYLPQSNWLKHLLNSSILEKTNLAETRLWLPPSQARYLKKIIDLIEKYSKPGESVILLPTLVTLYPMLQRTPPVYDLFCVYPATEEEESTMIKQLSENDPGFALINNIAVDRREQLRFSQTHPCVWQYLNHEFQILRDEDLPPDHIAFIRHR